MIEDVIEEDDEEEYNVGDATILGTIESLANKKAKDCASLSNKAIFKYMDLVEM
jgi:DNA-binding MltR family transcriptional regulator